MMIKESMLIIWILFLSTLLSDAKSISSVGGVDKYEEVVKVYNLTGDINSNKNNNNNNNNTCFGPEKTQCRDGIIISAWRPILEISIWERALRTVVYLFSMCYMFLGVSIISDRFMASIEVITSQEKRVKIRKPDGTVERVNVRIWNETVSNLTLMALGSSAPEIMLSVIEIIGRNFHAGDLGPGTIVGSAAFNLFIIIGLCVLVIPDGEVRKIKHLSVFLITSVWSLFAYLWLYLILAHISEGVVEIWEALLTFAFFPLTVISAYMADTKIFFNKFLKRRFLGSKIQSYAVDGGDIEFKLRNSQSENSNQNQITASSGFVDTTVSSDNDGINSTNYEEFENHRMEFLDTIREIRKRQPNIDRKRLEELAQYEVLNKGPKSRAFYRIQATRALTGSGNVLRRSKIEEISENVDLKEILVIDPRCHSNQTQQIYFDPGHYTVLENIGKMHLTVARSGPGIDNTIAEVDFYTEDGNAKEWEDYEPVQGHLVFGPGQTKATISISIVDDEEYEEDEHFFVHLHKLSVTPSAYDDEEKKDLSIKSVLANPATATVMILDDDHPGIFHFEEPSVSVSESIGSVVIKVVRSSGTRGHVTVPYRTVNNTAFGDGEDYYDVEGNLEFHNDQNSATITIPLTDTAEYEKDKSFFVELGQPCVTRRNCEKGRFQFVEDVGNRISRRGSKNSQSSNSRKNSLENNNLNDLEILGQPRLGEIPRIEIHIRESQELKNVVDHLMDKGKISQLLSTSSWKEQFKEAITVDNDNEDEDEESEGSGDQANENSCLKSETPKVKNTKKPPKCAYFMHCLTIFWKLLFAFVPPTDIWGGWLCFIVSISIIGILTAFIGDLASGFGCTIGLTDSVTAITFVALGTSLPDTIASKVAAISDPTADSSIGNVIGSNAVNVYLGIGLAWLIASCYHGARGEVFRVDPGTLGFSVTLYCILALFAISCMLFRRRPSIGGELGGPRRSKYITACLFFSLWLIYVVVSSLENYCHIKGF